MVGRRTSTLPCDAVINDAAAPRAAAGSGRRVRRAAAALVLAALGVAGAAPAAAQADRPVPVVRTQDGLVRGSGVDGVEAFRGIRYAAPPVGRLRFSPPTPAKPWKGRFDATRRSRPCAQLESSNGPAALNEDCLLLDVWRPKSGGGRKAEKPVPVLVLIHGGANLNGSASQQRPSAIVRQAGSIVVNINYRLGIFGWLAHRSLDWARGGKSGNLGLLDQQAALRWVQDNIERFGGDPANVTISGESAGGWAVCGNLASPGSAGLFHRAIIQSVTCDFREEAPALAQGMAIAKSLGCGSAGTAASCLRSKGPLALLRAWQGDASPAVRGSALPMQPMAAIEARDYNKVPVMFGNVYDEFSFFMLENPGMTQEQLAGAVAHFYPDEVGAILAEYAGARSPAWAFSAAMNDPFICGMRAQAARMSKSTPVWYYEFNDQNPPSEVGIGLNIGAYHSSELQYLYGFDRSDGTPKQSRPLDRAQRQLSAQMIGFWAAFASRGNPNHPGALNWPRFDTDTSPILHFQPQGSSVAGSSDADHHCGFWRGLGVPLTLPAPLRQP